MSEVGLREVRQNASELVRRAESGERLVITVSGRPAAVLGPIGRVRWRRWQDVDDIFAHHTAGWGERDRPAGVDDTLRDPWEPR